MVTAGSLLSYTPEQINQTMLQLASNAGKPNTLPGGKSFTKYFEEIIYPSATTFTVNNASRIFVVPVVDGTDDRGYLYRDDPERSDPF
jgi:hypothetical protein